MHRSRLLCLVAFTAALSACSYKPSFINEYKIDVQQGNVLSQESIGQLKPGQTRDQVRFLLGTPLITDLFHQQRWDYAYHYRNGRSGEVESRRLAVFFDADDRLLRVEGDVAPATAADLNAPVAQSRLVDLGSLSPEAAAQPLPPREPPGFFRRWLDNFGF